jgi:hypothetical protein
MTLALRTASGDTMPFTGRFREITSGIDPTLRLGAVQRLDEVLR